jgi:integrase
MTGARVAVPVGAPLKAAPDASKKRGPLILMNTRGRAWAENGFHASWRKAWMAAGVSGDFHDLRRMAVLRLFLAGGTEAEIATITGHSLRDVRSILGSHYPINGSWLVCIWRESPHYQEHDARTF